MYHAWSVLRIIKDPSFVVRITGTVNTTILLNVMAQKLINI